MPEGRGWLAPLGVLVVALAGFGIYNHAPPAVADVAIFPYAIALVLGPAVVYPALRVRGAPAGRAGAAALFVPLLWLVKECVRVSAVHGVAESVYYAFNPLCLGLFVGAALQMAIAELVLRRVRNGRWRLGGAPGWVIGGVAALAGAFAAVAVHDGPDVVFYAYIALYRWLFS